MDGSTPKYLAIAASIQERIASGEWSGGEALPGEKKLAEEMSANHLTVRRALRVLAEQGVVHTIPSRGTYVGPAPDSPDRGTGRLLVGIVFPDVELYFLRVIAEMETLMAARGLSPVIGLTRGSPVREADILRNYERLGVVGILAAPTAGSAQVYRNLAIPTVFFDSALEGLPIPSVVTDDFQGSRAAVAHLVSLGHRRIAHIGGGREATSDQRVRGYMKAMADAGIRVPAEYHVRREFSREWGHLAAERLFRLPSPPTAICCGNDVIAAGVLRCLDELGMRCPQDVSVIGYSDSELSRDLQLSTVRQPMQRLAATAWRTLAALLEGRHTPRENRLETSLVVRRSTGPLPSETRRSPH